MKKILMTAVLVLGLSLNMHAEDYKYLATSHLAYLLPYSPILRCIFMLIYQRVIIHLLSIIYLPYH